MDLPIPVISALLLTSSLVLYSRSKAASGAVCGLLAAACLNPYMVGLLGKNHLDTIQQLSWVAFVLGDACESTASVLYAFLGVSSALNPSNSLFFFLRISSTTKKEAAMYVAGVGMSVVWLHMAGVELIDYYWGLYFPTSFSVQFNLLWMLYGHMFGRYLQLYQVVFLVLQVSSLYLVATLPFGRNWKAVLLTYFKVYCSYQCSQLCVVLSLLASALLAKQQLWWEREVRASVSMRTLTLIIVIANMVFLPLDIILARKYLSDFSLNIGYLFLFFGFPWILNSVYLAEISLTIHQLNQQHYLASSQTTENCNQEQ